MTQLEGSGGGAIGSLWRKHGGGYYALLAIGTFVYLEAVSIIESFSQSESVGDFVSSEVVETIVTLGIETFLNSLLAGFWPVMWVVWMGLVPALAWAAGGYVVWALILAWLLSRREKELRSQLGL